ncbi:peptidoglycan-binding protein [Chrysosporum bergii ANA360D]|uniref:Peptidoglycan-binding protein n=1 Tax=Chrysosporum bergii ANA360D TaxID=617107 RepID=A0AA43GTW4_9CYAN|nr:peptidoglycan-binding domain-containing protein [Chrysosporum bergii]MDH6061519.1 peptidoglycan-binding protein [Chrysosporum bergii ANA360D]
MSDIGLLITSILTTKQLFLANKSYKGQPLPMENSPENLTRSNLAKLASNASITPPEFMPTDAVSPRNSSTSNSPKQQLFDHITNRNLLAGGLPIANHYYASESDYVKVSGGGRRFRGLSLPILSFGSHGTSVRVLQRLLISNGYAIRVDGAFGPLTETAVKAFQNQRLMVVDGVVGPVTWQELTM